MESHYYKEEHIREKLKGQHFMHHIGFEITQIKAGYVEGEMAVENHIKQQLGYVHGGLIATIADIVAGFAAYSVTPIPQNVVSIELKISYFKPAKGDRIKAIGTVIKKGRKVHFCESEIWVHNENQWTLVAKNATSMAVI